MSDIHDQADREERHALHEKKRAQLAVAIKHMLNDDNIRSITICDESFKIDTESGGSVEIYRDGKQGLYIDAKVIEHVTMTTHPDEDKEL